MAHTSYSEAWLEGVDGHRFYTRTYPATPSPKAVLLFVHGFGDHISRYTDIHPRFAEQGITVFAYDLRGFGRTALDKAERSPNESYGKTSRIWEVKDLQWWTEHVHRQYPDIPMFVLGHSAGGGLVAAFATLAPADIISNVSGIIAQCPLIRLTYPPPKLVQLLAAVLSRIVPSLSIPAPMPAERFSHDAAVNEALAKDPLRMPQGTVLGLHSMLTQGEELLSTGYSRWPENLPLLMTWGTADEVNCPKAGIAFYNKLDIKDKQLIEYDGAFHDLLHEVNGVADRNIEAYINWINVHLGVPAGPK